MLLGRILHERIIKMWRNHPICGKIIRTFAAVFREGTVKPPVQWTDYVVDTGIHFGHLARLL